MITSNLNKVLKTIDETISNDNELQYAVFDFDNTCIINDIGESVFNFLCKNKLLKDNSFLDKDYSNLFEYHAQVFQHYYQLLDQGKMIDAYSFACKCLSGFSKEAICSITKEVINFEGSFLSRQKLFGRVVNKGLAKRAEIQKIFLHIINKGIQIWIVSASSKYIVVPAFKIFFPNIEAKYIGVENSIKNNLITSELVYPLSILDGKVENIKNQISKTIKPVFGIGDSVNDEPMLEYSTLSILIDRQNSLSEYSKKNSDWVTFRI